MSLNNNISMLTALLVMQVLLVNCSGNKFIINGNSLKFEGYWSLEYNNNKKLIIDKIEENVYNLRFTFGNVSWMGIGYKVKNKLLTIFNYSFDDQYGYATFKFVKNDVIKYSSMNSDGKLRSKGNYYRVSE